MGARSLLGDLCLANFGSQSPTQRSCNGGLILSYPENYNIFLIKPTLSKVQ